MNRDDLIYSPIEEIHSEVVSISVLIVHLTDFNYPIEENGSHLWLDGRMTSEDSNHTPSTSSFSLFRMDNVPEIIADGPSELLGHCPWQTVEVTPDCVSFRSVHFSWRRPASITLLLWGFLQGTLLEGCNILSLNYDKACFF